MSEHFAPSYMTTSSSMYSSLNAKNVKGDIFGWGKCQKRFPAEEILLRLHRSHNEAILADAPVSALRVWYRTPPWRVGRPRQRRHLHPPDGGRSHREKARHRRHTSWRFQLFRAAHGRWGSHAHAHNCLDMYMYSTLLGAASRHSLGFEDEDLGSSPGWWAATVPTYCPSRSGELPNSYLQNLVNDRLPHGVV